MATNLENLAQRVGKSRERDDIAEKMRGLAARLQHSKNHRRPDGVAPQDDAAESLIHSHTFLEDGLKQIGAAILALVAPKNTVNQDLLRMLEEALNRCDESRALMADMLEKMVAQREGGGLEAEEIFPKSVGEDVVDADFDFTPHETGSEITISDLWSSMGESDEEPHGAPVVALLEGPVEPQEKPRLGHRM